MKRIGLGLATAGLALVLGTAVAVSASKKEEAALAAADARGLLADPESIDAALAVDHIARSLAKDLAGPLAQ